MLKIPKSSSNKVVDIVDYLRFYSQTLGLIYGYSIYYSPLRYIDCSSNRLFTVIFFYYCTNCTPLIWQISICIPLFISVYVDVRSYCSLLSLSYLTNYYYLLPFFLAFTVSLLFCFPLCLLYRSYSICLFSVCVYCIISLSLFSSLYICKTVIWLLSSQSLFYSKFSKLNTVSVNDLYFRILLDNNNNN